MKWGLRIFGILDLLTFLIFIPSKINHLLSTFQFPFSLSAKVSAFWEISALFFFLTTALYLWFKPKLGLLFTFFLIPFRVVFSYYSFDFLSYLAYNLGFSTLVSSANFQYNWFYCLLTFEAFRYLYSFYLYYKLGDCDEND